MKIIILVFVVFGLELGSPCLVLNIQPAWLKFLPKPGLWMEKFKIAMGFPMLATAIWMLTLSAPHFGSSGLLWFGLFLVVFGFAAWIWGEFVQRGRNRRALAMAASAILVIGA